MSIISSFKKVKNLEFLLGCVFIVYLVLGLDMPEPIATWVDTILGKIVLFTSVIFMFLNMSPALAGLALFVAVDIVRRASKTTGFDALRRFSPSSKKRDSHMESYNKVPYTLEQEIISKIPINSSGGSMFSPKYKPVFANTEFNVSNF
jgi:hypothetical protein